MIHGYILFIDIILAKYSPVNLLLRLMKSGELHNPYHKSHTVTHSIEGP